MAWYMCVLRKARFTGLHVEKQTADYMYCRHTDNGHSVDHTYGTAVLYLPSWKHVFCYISPSSPLSPGGFGTIAVKGLNCSHSDSCSYSTSTGD